MDIFKSVEVSIKHDNYQTLKKRGFTKIDRPSNGGLPLLFNSISKVPDQKLSIWISLNNQYEDYGAEGMKLGIACKCQAGQVPQPSFQEWYFPNECAEGSGDGAEAYVVWSDWSSNGPEGKELRFKFTGYTYDKVPSKALVEQASSEDSRINEIQEGYIAFYLTRGHLIEETKRERELIATDPKDGYRSPGVLSPIRPGWFQPLEGPHGQRQVFVFQNLPRDKFLELTLFEDSSDSESGATPSSDDSDNRESDESTDMDPNGDFLPAPKRGEAYGTRERGLRGRRGTANECYTFTAPHRDTPPAPEANGNAPLIAANRYNRKRARDSQAQIQRDGGSGGQDAEAATPGRVHARIEDREPNMDIRIDGKPSSVKGPGKGTKTIPVALDDDDYGETSRRGAPQSSVAGSEGGPPTASLTQQAAEQSITAQSAPILTAVESTDSAANAALEEEAKREWEDFEIEDAELRIRKKMIALERRFGKRSD